MAKPKSSLGSALGFITVIVTTVMAAIKEHGEEVILGLSEDQIKELTKKFVSDLVAAAKPPINCLGWKTVRVGMHKTVADLCTALQSAGFRIGDWAGDIMKNKLTLAQTESELDLVVMTVADLGFKDRATRKEIYDRAIELGLRLCPAEVGPALRLTYKSQPYGELLLIGMEPIAVADGGL